jgi:hypothetical protein
MAASLSQPQPAAKTRRPSGLLVVKAVRAKERPKGSVATEGGCRGVLTVGSCTIEAMDGHLLGLAAWVLDAGAVTVELSKSPGQTWRVKSNAQFLDSEIERLCYLKAHAERDEGWFVKRFDTAFYGGHNAVRAPISVPDAWTEQSLPRVLALIPEQFRVNTEFKRAAAYDSEGIPLPAARANKSNNILRFGAAA